MQRLGRTILKYEQWQVELQTLPHAKDLTKQLDAEGGYAITHVGRLTRQDGRSFRISHGDRVLADLHYFLSFARGLSTTPVLPVGFDAAGSRIFEEWGMRLVTAWEPRRSWFDTMHGQCLADLYPGFMDLLRDADLGDSVRTALYWYLRSNRAGEGAGVDSGVILSQAALERLASAYLPFSRLPTVGSVHERLRRAFKHMKLPVAIPNEMRAIAKGKRNKDWKDLPQALTKVRNELTHPQARLKVKLGDVVADVWDIAQWYVELSILRLCGYNGVYSNRLRARWVGQVEEVPWQRRKARKR
ncbi:hypothetical protein OCH7691_03706 [Oceanibacterium hippocampi]|uniref:YopA central domain-containing protein n=2 Tax=Oceanibacterium hippocampi TaxID=745714 RepID=A0A1Y5TVE8_9PROT|nr:hypothetical protein OCH7691_03706 [Oceanibacterium hippocampi]